MKQIEKQRIFEGGGFAFIIGLIALQQGSFDGALLFCGIGIVSMTSVYPDKAKQLLDVFLKGFTNLLKIVFPSLF